MVCNGAPAFCDAQADGHSDGGGVHRVDGVYRFSGSADAQADSWSYSTPMRELFDTVDFLGTARSKMRSGTYSREPLMLLRVEWKGDSVECDWLMRPPDPWDGDLPKHLARENQTLQALRDALSLREIVFRSFPAVVNAELRMFRTGDDHRLELVMRGSTSRSNEELYRVASVAMRAKLCGFQFTLAEGGHKSLVPISLS